MAGKTVSSEPPVKAGLRQALSAPVRLAMGLVDVPMRAWQKLTGLNGMAGVFLAPNMLIFTVFVLLPLVINFLYSTTSGSGIFLQNRTYVGADQYHILFDCGSYLDPSTCAADTFWAAVRNTAVFVVFQVTAMLIAALATALILNRELSNRGFWRAVFFFPVLLSPVVVGLIWKWILQRQGLLNYALSPFGFEPFSWLSDRFWAFFFAVFVSVWAHMGFYALILLAGLQAIPRDLYEAAAMDKASPTRIFRRITLPLLMPNLIVVLVLALIRAVQIFDEVFVLTGGGPGTSTMYITQYIYETGFASSLRNPGLASAASILMGIVLVILTLVQLGQQPQREEGNTPMSAVGSFLLRRRGRGWHWTDIVTWIWLISGVFLMFGPAVWLVFSSFKTPAALAEFPPSFLPYVTEQAVVPGYDKPLPLYTVTIPDGSSRVLAEVRRIGIIGQMVDPKQPGEIVKANIKDRIPVRKVEFAAGNYTEPFQRFDFFLFLRNSVFVTVIATAITLLVNSMAAFALSKYQFPGRTAVMLMILATLMVPLSVIVVPLYSVIGTLNLFDSLWGVILPTVATPTGVFLLRQYMLTIPDELIDAARMDKASEWQIYWRIILPLSAPALAVLAIFSVVWRWNDFLWPLIVLSRKELYTLQVGLNVYAGELNVQWHYILAMTVVSMIPVVLIFVFLQRFITTGIAGSGLK